ncbi:DUF1772 domain-containing protein [Isoptericola croceus]|uniref:DUF1772 domain-containing protein n=1 Tax=Isoptericola croceus TaxID=3031406 RepID=UPI0023F6C74B|nr:DUF1772 domain-containing protein [Isoptericola croceus]
MSWLPVVTIVTVGLMVGVELAVASVVNPIADRLPDNAGVVARREAARRLGRVMPFWYIGSVLLTAGTALTLPARGTGVAPAWVAAALLAISIVLSVALLVPINNRSKDWTPTTAPVDWRQQLRRWDRLHGGRLVLIVAAFVLVVVAVAR